MIKLRDLLTEVLVKNKKTGNVYNVVKMNPQTQEKPTPKDIEKSKAKNGGKIPSEKPTPNVQKDKTATPQNLQKLTQLKKQAADKEVEKMNYLLGKHGITKNSAIKANYEANELANSITTKGKGPKDINPDAGKNIVDSIKHLKLNQNRTTKELTSKLQKSPYGKFVKDEKNDNLTFFFYDGSKYEMHMDRKTKSITTKNLEPNQDKSGIGSFFKNFLK